MNAPLRGVVVAHGDMAAGLISAVRRITGLEDGALTGLSNEGLGPDAIRERVDSALEGGPGVIFSDLREGSCGIAGRKVCLARGDRLLVTGVNLPMLLDFVTRRHLSLAELADRLVDRGKSAVAAYPGAPAT